MKPMENIRVVELSTMLAGPMTARILAEWGADVVKVESVNGDAWRKQAGTTLSPCTKDANPNFDVQNMNKRFVCLNLRTEAGRDAMMKLLSGADIFITNYRVQALEPMGLTYEQLKETFPRLIHASVLGYGSEGPESSRPGYDYTVFFARTGLMADLAPAGGPPLIPVGGIGDHSVAVALSGGIAAALYKRSVTGEGDKVDVSLLQAGTFINCTGILNGFNGRKLPRDRYDCGHAGSNTYQGSDGEWFYLAIIDYRRFPEFCQVIGMPEIAADPRFSTSDVYYENRGELTKILDKKFAEQPVSYWHELLDAHDLPHEVLHHFKDVPYDPQVQANHYTYFHEYSDGTKTVFSNGPVHFGSIDPSAIPCRISGSIGRDTDEVLKEIGYTDEQIHAMYQSEEIK
ncbi:putative 3-methyl-2-oxobutanoate dehydrogenase (2-methylpropanoyl-transferring) [Clostridium sp. MSTE9]|uniref:CaiB/BaiF CoA transferase family protein n=1 Tax=Clostridium sp. (strain MSTE9) TaxID=1105031 RepID=UPI00026F2FBF|nr:CaiB/BaiF CoA-transferase family protein [Clostridium sp. MSTE9]EJF40599.1 putative 3-methyl-2-oxobutanoate dehydrogenase (2-methylpropanoyl-transferring) [Clostridium sp. MSTE9]